MGAALSVELGGAASSALVAGAYTRPLFGSM